MRLFIAILLISAAGLIPACRKAGPVLPPAPAPAGLWIGFNQNWSFLPAFNTTMLFNTKLLKPQMIRYPGGTVTHDWDWVSGKRISAPNTTPHPIADIRSLTDATGAKMIFVLDIVNRTIDDQIAMLNAIKALNVPIEYIELGNELYASDAAYIAAFPSGADYAAKATQWANRLRAAFPTVKIAALLQCRNADASNPRFRDWNYQVVNGTASVADAYTYHIYIPTGGSFATRKTDFEAVAAATGTGSKELWVTEYGNQNDLTDPNYYKSLDSLANYVESHPKITIALNHLIVGNNKNKLTSDGLTFTAEGQLFLTRAGKR